MRSSIPLHVTALLLTASGANAFWRMNCGIIQTGRVDPIMNPKAVSDHIHKISGAANININSTFDSLTASSCTSCQIQGDKSAYWTPSLYYAHANGTFQEVPNGGMTVYYLGRGESNQTKPFPKGLKFLSGNSDARGYDATTLAAPGGSALADRVSYACLNDSPEPATPGFANTNCRYGLRAQIHMQSCWDGVSLYKSDQSHMAYLSRIDNGVCPPTHPVLLPHLFYEVLYSVDKIDTSAGGKYMLSNDDDTGFSFHGDFFNGWDNELLTDAIENCLINNKNPSGVVESCSSFDNSNSPDAAARCTERSPVYPCEQVKGLLPFLPGCTNSNSTITCSASIQPPCPAVYNTLGLSASPGNDQYSHIGCYTEAASGRALTGARHDNNTGMTVDSCLDFCAGSTYAGAEYGQECYCGDALGAGSALTAETQCDMPCAGNEYQTCGAGRRLNLYRLKSAMQPNLAPLPFVTATVTATAVAY